MASAGVSVIASSAANAIDQVLVNASGRNSRPSVRLEREDGQERHGDHEQREEHRAAHLLQRGRIRPPRAARCGPPVSQSSSRLCTFSTMMIEASTMAPIATAMPPSDMMLAFSPWPVHRDEREQHRDRQRQDRDQRAAEVEQEQHDHEADDQHLLDQPARQRVHRVAGSDRSGRR